MILDLIVPHYKEPWNLGKPFFDMLACQRGINFKDFRVLLVHDGQPEYPKEYFEGYPYKVVQLSIKHAGVSAARNYGLEYSDAKWVCFCDFDDTFTNIYALRAVMSHMDKDVDYMWTKFFIECFKNNDICAKIKGENLVWVHGKFFRRQWLLDNDLKFPVGIHYSEDSAFGALVNELAQPNRRGEIKSDYPLYTWAFRPDSVSVDPKNIKKNMTGFIDRNEYVVAEFKHRGIQHIYMVGRMFADAYWAFHQMQRKFPDEEERFIGMAKKHLPDLKKVEPKVMGEIIEAARATFYKIPMDVSESFVDWIKRIEG